MISKETIDDLEGDNRGWLYILGARMRAQREAASSLREQTAILEAALRQTTEQTASSTVEQERLEVRIAELRQLAARMVEESAREQASSKNQSMCAHASSAQ